ncbi:uncharacterized protein LOC118235312 isoform X4 [Anguilla anguilla]|uniref:uncharacterized protein LOC118235312 isoform X4 n=1 Tax=Anguilla anguilla TaxID=7936 RepID=UPI0015B05D3A|nr:uncharacterized protein LOC118235312 isoform X4 [Anguilla anguilla]
MLRIEPEEKQSGEGPERAMGIPASSITNHSIITPLGFYIFGFTFLRRCLFGNDSRTISAEGEPAYPTEDACMTSPPRARRKAVTRRH